MKSILLTRGYSAIVDDEDFEWLSQFKWHVNISGGFQRAHSFINGKLIYMHRLIVGAERGEDTDHANRNSLDNRKCNLRIATRSQNNANSICKLHGSRFKGVSWERSTKKWRARGGTNGTRIHLGRFDSEEDAARAYDAWALKNYGQFARPNFPS